MSNYILNALNGKEKRIHDIYLKHNTNDLKQPDSLTPNDEGGIMMSGGKLNKDNFLKVLDYESQAVVFYDERNKNDDDVIAISNNTNFDFEDILRIKKHMMSDKIRFRDGIVKSFDPDIDQALAWKRLISGEKIRESDFVLLNHELLELTVMHEKNMCYEDAHDLANEKYNWEKIVAGFDDEDELF